MAGPKDPDTMSIAELREEHKALVAEAHDLRMRLNAEIHHQARRDRDIEAVARRSAYADITGRAELVIRKMAAERLQPVEGALYRIEQLPDRPRAEQVTALKQAAATARHLLSLHKDPQLEADAVSTAYAEVARLRAYITGQGHALHDLLEGRQTPGRCTCQGCDLIRGMDTPSASERLADRQGADGAAREGTA